jgi:membrane-associated phospholipid phosphatase
MASTVPAAAHQRQTAALVAAAACGLCLVGVGVLALALGAGHERDAAVLHGFAGLYRPTVNSEIEVTARLADPVPYALVGLVCIAVALARRRTWRAAAVGTTLIGTGVTAQALKHVLAQPRYADWLGFAQIDDASWPSGHATAAMTLALCAVMVAPPAWRAGVALLGGAVTVALAYATLALAWHYPADVLGGFLLAGLWVSLVLAALQELEADEPEPERPPPLRPLILVGGAGAIAAAAIVGAASERVTLYPAERATAIAGALAIAALALAILVATVVNAASGPGAAGGRRASPRPRHPPSVSAERDRTLRAGRARAAPGDSPPRRTPARGSSPGAP